MTFTFDLISDLHIETWEEFDWTHQATSPYCIVVGDVCRDRQVLIDTLTHLGEQYAGVFYIDGNDEHRYFLEDIGESYHNLSQVIEKIPNVVYMQDNVVIINGVAFLATNGWWCYDFDPTLDVEQSIAHYQDRMQISRQAATAITGFAYHDAAYLINSVNRLQTHKDVKSIVMISHTLPAPWLVEHDVDLVGTWRFNTMGNRHLELALAEDTENKITTWCFGHYHKSVDRMHNGIRYVSNCRGRGDTEWKQTAYYPKRIDV
jgi:hypothetical protein